ncbi:DUF2959 domain-containing protein [Desulfovibrio ferrophilus]|uniref:DNA repair ATPase n=1 Tax=Desulfovibrio ferrophilus TaxID=241368 RepID=A0A2Z6B261_9BACT|nr:DUF2959 domain-containing protein [Desulfovibrio ferrophilus]BBD09607.1 uncharacterized protein DFE_2881 [Desulfovibrio ferrophilus]
MRPVVRVIPLLLCLLTLVACQKAYYGAMEKVGIHKRDILVDRVEDARDSQAEAKEEFANALERFQSVVKVDGGELQETYERLNSTYEDCDDKAQNVSTRIAKVQDVAEALFEEWQAELNQYSSAKLRQQSASQLTRTKREYKKLLSAMRKAEKSMHPVLSTLHDQVLFLKHNLNARAIASIKNELDTVERDVASLVKTMEVSINEANQFIEQMLGD